jgi:uncharacterized membrane protein YdjX (TVP38/TMEM64 family)
MFFLLTFFVAFVILRFPGVHDQLSGLADFGLLGAFLGGMLYTVSFTVAAATVILTILSEHIHPLAVGVVGGLGAVVGDLLIFRFVRDSLADEIKHLVTRNHGRAVITFFRKRSVRGLLPIIGSLIILSPLPDELGIGLMGLSHLSALQFAPISYVLNTIGIILLTAAMRG